MGNIYDDPNATSVHITAINNTAADLESNLDNGQIGIETDTGLISCKDDGGDYHRSAPRSSLTAGKIPKCSSATTGLLTDSVLQESSSNIGVDIAPTARLTLPAGAATANKGPLKFTAGPLVSAPEVGLIEFYANRFWVTCVDTQRVLDRTSDVKLTTTTVTNTAVETTVYTASIPANSLIAENILRLNMSGKIDEASAADTCTIRIKFGGTTISSIVSPGSGLSSECWHIKGDATIRSVGATGSMAWHIDMDVGGTSDDACDVTAVDTTAAEDVTVTAQWNNAKAGNILTCTQGFVEYKH